MSHPPVSEPSPFAHAGVAGIPVTPPPSAESQGGILPRLAVPPTPASVAVVRRSLTADLADVAPDECVADAALVVSELVSNAIRHAGPVTDNGYVVNWHLDEQQRSVVIAVTDGVVDSEPRAQPPSLASNSGRGLAIVGTLADEWGVQRTTTHKTVWARVPLRRHALARSQ